MAFVLIARSADRPFGTATSGRSVVAARNAMAATSQPLATQVALDTLKKGGNAFDAAVAAAAALAVVEPMMTGPGGDLFMLAYSAENAGLIGLNASGYSPAAVDREFFTDRRLEKIPTVGPFSVSIPGAVDGWVEVVEKYGELPLGDVLAPAIALAEEGFPVSEIIAGDWGRYGPAHAGEAEFNRVFLKNGAPYRHGEVFRNPDLARTLRAIAADGRDAFYVGEFAERAVAFLNERDWPVEADDFAAQRSEWVEPISTRYRGYQVHELPPNGQGMAALEMLNILEGYDLQALGHNTAPYLHLLIEAKKLAFADLGRWLADPAKARLPMPEIISKAYGEKQRGRIDPNRAAADVRSGVDVGPGDTVYLTVVDKDRNVVSFINSIFHAFGSGLVVPGTGVILQNRGALFTLEEGHPNVIEPRKRPYHTIIPAMAFKDGKPWLSFGVMGGDMQPQGHVQVLLNRIDFGMNVQDAGEAPRFRHNADEGVALESGIDPTTVHELTRLGHDVRWRPGIFGGYQAIEIDWERGVLLGGSDPRKDGMAAGY